jgi:hypothetical protein
MGTYVFTLASGPISWQSRKQLTVSRNSTESEYCALSDGAQKAVWLHQLFIELQVVYTPLSYALSSFSPLKHSPPSFSITLFYDNQGTMKLSHNPVFHARSKHIEIHYHFIRERILAREIRLEYIRTHDQPIDALIKPLGKLKLMEHRNILGISLTSLSRKLLSKILSTARILISLATCSLCQPLLCFLHPSKAPMLCPSEPISLFTALFPGEKYSRPYSVPHSIDFLSPHTHSPIHVFSKH